MPCGGVGRHAPRGYARIMGHYYKTGAGLLVSGTGCLYVFGRVLSSASDGSVAWRTGQRLFAAAVCHQLHGVPGDDDFLVGRNHDHLDLGVVGGEYLLHAPTVVSLLVHLHAEVFQP